MNFTVRFDIEISADTPRQAAIMARDVLLNPDAHIGLDVHPMEYVQTADMWVPVENHGWHGWFRDSVRPAHFFAWERMNLKAER